MRLRRSDPAARGWTRRRHGRGFSYRDSDGAPLASDDVARVKALAIPPAWTDVWICPTANGHIQAVGTDAAGRRQYLYHPEWRASRDLEKHDRVLAVSARLPRARRSVASALRETRPTRERALAAAFRLLDLGSLRIGSEQYLQQHETFGLATLRRDQVEVEGRRVTLHYPAKGSIPQEQCIDDAPLARVLGDLVSRDDAGEELLAWQDDTGAWRDIVSADINGFIAEQMGHAFTAKDFRTWNATVLMAQTLAFQREAATDNARRKAVTAGYRCVASYLGNTPTIARTSYVDPRVVDLFLDGVTVPARVLPRRHRDRPVHDAVERAVRRMLRRPTRSLTPSPC